jgi:hypothetical protein
MMAALRLQPCQPPGADEWDCLLDVTCSLVRVASRPNDHLDLESTDIEQVEVWYGLAYGLLQVDTISTEAHEAVAVSQSNANSPASKPMGDCR